MSEHTEALRKIIKICRDSSQFSRRTQACLNTALLALGFTENQRRNVFIESAQRAEAWREKCGTEGRSAADKWFKEDINKVTGEAHKGIKKQFLDDYV